MKNIIKLLFFLIFCEQVCAQELMDILNKETPQTKEFVSATFKGTRIINGQSIENRKKGVLEFLISHRFGRINEGIDNFFGLDDSNIRFGLEYAFTDNLTLGLGRSSYEKTYDGFVKYKFLKQSIGVQKFPFSMSLFGSIAKKTIKNYEPENEPDFNDRLFYTTQVLIARKFNKEFSLQLSPTYIHRNTVAINSDPHDIFVIGAGGRYKVSKRVSINAEYFHTINPLKSIDTHNSLAFSVDIETGGHVFQLILSNAITMIENSFITETTGNFFKGDIHFGFNISRDFQIGKRHKKPKEEKN